MAKRPIHHEDMELQALKQEMATMTRRVEEVITILGGNSAYGLTGMKSDFKDLKVEVQQIKQEIENIKRNEAYRWSVPLKTVPQKIVAVVAFLALLLTIVQTFKDIMSK